MAVVGTIVLVALLALLALVVVGHLTIPYAVLAKARRRETGGVSGLWGVDWLLLLSAALVAWVSGLYPPRTLLLMGSCAIVGSYLHGWIALAIGSRFVR